MAEKREIRGAKQMVDLCLENLKDLDDGRAAAVINSAINSAVADLIDRGDDEKERKVNVEIRMGKDKDTGKYYLCVEAGTKVPKYRTFTTECKAIRRAGGDDGLFFQPDNPENADQQTFDFPQKDQEAEQE